MCSSAQQPQPKTDRESLAEFVRQETDGGREIVQFFLDVLRNRFEDAKMCHRVAAARELAKYGCEEAQQFLNPVANSGNGHTPTSTSGEIPPKDDLADFIKLETDDGKEVIRFYLDVLRDRIEDARMRHRISVGKELLKRGFDIVPVHTDGDYQDEDNKECRNKSCYHWQYAVKRWHIDGHNREALEQLYGSEEAASVAIRSVIQLRQNTVRLHSHVPDHDFTPIENPEDDPDGKGSYGYEILFASFGDNQAVRVANRAVEKYKKQLAEDLETGKEDSDEAPNSDQSSASEPKQAETASTMENTQPADTPGSTRTDSDQTFVSPDPGDSESTQPAPPSSVILERSEESPARPPPEPDFVPTLEDHLRWRAKVNAPKIKPRRPRLPIYLGPPSEDTDEDSEAKDIRVPLKDVRSTSYVHF